jgi:HEAT repeat protein
MSSFPDLVQSLQMAIKALSMYTGAHPRTRASLDAFVAQIGEWLAEKPSLHIASSRDRIFLDGTLVEHRSLHLTALARQMSERAIGGLVWSRGVTAEEVLEVLRILTTKPAKLTEAGGVAEVMAKANLPHVRLSQTTYKEVKEGEGEKADDDSRGPALDTPQAEKPSQQMQEAVAAALAQMAPSSSELRGIIQLWQEQLAALVPEPLPAPPGTDDHPGAKGGELPPADLSPLGPLVRSLGWGEGFPSSNQIEPLRKALLGLPFEAQLSILQGAETHPDLPPSLRMAFQALAPLVFAQATAGLLASGTGWSEVKGKIFSVLQASTQKQALLAALDAKLRGLGLDPAYMDALMRQLDWDGQTLEEKVRRMQEEGRIWELTLEQRLAFLRLLIQEDRVDTFLKLLDEILEALHEDDVDRREAAAETLAGVASWWQDPGLPRDAEGPLIQGLSAHFGWEPINYVHRFTAEALASILAGLLEIAELVRAQELILELTALCEFMAVKEPWREAALLDLRNHLLSPEAVRKAVDALLQLDAHTMAPIMAQYFEFIGEPAARLLVNLLGDEPDRKRRARLLEMIRSMGDRALPAVLEGLRSPQWFLVRNTLNLLADMGGASAMKAVEVSLDHPDARVRRTAVRTLWKVGGPASVPRLLDTFQVSDAETQMEIMFGFSQVRSALCVDTLGLFALDRRNPDRLRAKAVETLGLVGDASATDTLAELLRRKGMIFTNAEVPEIRLAAARALVQLSTTRSLEILRQVVAAEPRNKDHAMLKQVLDHLGQA